MEQPNVVVMAKLYFWFLPLVKNSLNASMATSVTFKSLSKAYCSRSFNRPRGIRHDLVPFTHSPDL
jgi:hypothetical protein